MENKLETKIEVYLEHYPVPKTVLESQITSLAASYKDIFEKLKTQYKDQLARVKEVGSMMGSDRQTLD